MNPLHGSGQGAERWQGWRSGVVALVGRLLSLRNNPCVPRPNAVAEPWGSGSAAPPAWARLGPLRFNVSKGGLSSISVGGRGASFNIPVSCSRSAQQPPAEAWSARSVEAVAVEAAPTGSVRTRFQR
jgi:hypothetical protein